MPYTRYIKEYKDRFAFTPADSYSFTVCGIDVEVKTYVYEEGFRRSEMAEVALKRGEKEYSFECVDGRDSRRMFHETELDGRKKLIFARALYGFSVIDAESFEVYDYFPESLDEGDESFIVTSAKSHGGFVVFYGTYWAFGDDFLYVSDTKFNKFLMFRGEDSVDLSVLSDGKILIEIRDEGGKKTDIVLSETELLEKISKEGTSEFEIL